MNIKIIIISVLLLMLLSSCKSVKEGLSGRKSDNSDEFLIEKKAPLKLPPEFERLPLPGEDDVEPTAETESIKDSILNSSNKKAVQKSSNESIEKIILDKIKKK
jgi:hypothetical protein|tara:strand:+ start:1466 stop:1777 length:312 start_codon:yes stop_codon:yes gene_type:complete